MARAQADIAILGGGLAGGLAALALAARRPDLRVLVVEAQARLGGHHIWSLFDTDIAPEHRWLVDPLVEARWPGYAVHFPAFNRRMRTGYTTLTSDRLDAALRAALPDEQLITGVAVTSAEATGFTLTDGREFSVGAVIDARGAAGLPGMTGGWQKFAGRVLRLEQPHGLKQPLLMDADVVQEDGFRFVYCLPFTPDTLLVEDTYYALTPRLDPAALDRNIRNYCRVKGWQIAQVLREEQGVLPVVARGAFARLPVARRDGPAVIGTGAGLFHPLTGYSLPQAVATACFIAERPDLSPARLAHALRARARAHWRRGAFYRLLAVMLFGAARGGRRYKVFQRFYRLKSPLIERFYAGTSRGLDKLRLLSGRPPVPLGGALAALAGRVALSRLDTPFTAASGKHEDTTQG